MENKIVLNAIEMVEVSMAADETIPSLGYELANGEIFSHLFLFKDNDSREKFINMIGESITDISARSQQIGFKSGLYKGFKLAFGVVTIAVVGGMVVAYTVDKMKKHKSKKVLPNESDIS